jgi:hypothetical protein
MKSIIQLVLCLVLLTAQSSAEEWIRILSPDSVSIAISHTKKVVEIETWKLRGHKNFVNLSFWGSRGPIGKLHVDGINNGFGKPSWPVLSISPYLGEYKEGPLQTGFAGSNVLVRGGIELRQRRSFFTKRRCPRTGVGITKDGKLMVIVTTSATMQDFAKRFADNGAVFAINVDGGSSTMFIENGKSLWNSKRSAVPVILSW